MAGTGSTSVRSYDFYRDSTLGAPALSTDFATGNFAFTDDLTATPFVSFAVMIANDDTTNDIFFSWDGQTVHGRIRPGTNVSFEHKRKRQIFLRGATGGEAYRLWAW